ncbi:hypothetical protein Q3G72_005696 [Acer saccharum]|nr:hypothetical protein Q3G72_005696 [Acer saccharum]
MNPGGSQCVVRFSQTFFVLCSELTEFSFSYVPRKGNQVAHILAKNALLLEEDRFWLEEYLCCAAEEVLVDSFG